MNRVRIPKLVLFLISLFFPLLTLAQGYLYIEGSIPLKEHRPPATDLIYQGQEKTNQELVELRKSGIDLSELTPRLDTSIWNNTIGGPLNPDDDNIGLNVTQPVEYMSSQRGRTGVFRFTIRQNGPDGSPRIFRVILSKNVHSYLLRKNLLRKLGYVVPPIFYTSRMNVKFKGEITKKDFITKLSGATLGDAKRWIRTGTEEGVLQLELQDAIVFPDKDFMYNLGTGVLSGVDHIRGRRVLNSLIVPYSIVNVQESVEGLPWTLGRRVNEFVVLNAENAQEFTPDKSDAIWALKRIRQLKREDFKEVVDKSYFPESVGLLLTEKLISRRNTVLKQFDLLDNNEIKFDVKVSLPPELVSGSLTQEWWDGHAARYAYPDPESPLSPAEIRAFFKSKALSGLLSAGIQKFDEQFLMGTDIEKKVIEKQIEAAKKQFVDFLKTGVYKKIPLGFFAFPTIDGDIGVSRDIVTGEYLGSDNMIQLADTLDFSVAPGVYVGAVGLPTNVFFQAGAQLRIGRSYTHLKPLKSIRRALKEPFKNILVNLVKKEHGEIFDEILNDEYQKIEKDDDKRIKLVEIMKVFNETMAKGDSFIISDNISADMYGAAGYQIIKNLSVQASLYHSRLSVGRLHIMKVSDDTLQIYKDKGDVGITGVGLSLEAYLPVITLNFSRSSGRASTDFYSLDINPNNTEIPKLEKNLIALRQVFKENSLELIKLDQNPYKIKHNFNERSTDFKLLMFKHRTVDSFDRIDVAHPKGTERAFLRHSLGAVAGVDYQGLTVEAMNAVFKEVFEQDIEIPNPNSGDPGDTFKGKSNLRNSVLEVEIEPKTGQQIDSAFFNIAYRWKGWKMSDKKMRNLIEEVNEQFGNPLFSQLDFLNAKAYELYSLDVNIYMYEDAMQRLMNIPAKELSEFLNKYAKTPKVATSPRGQAGTSPRADKIRWVMIYREKALKNWNKMDRSSLKSAAQYMNALELILPFDRFIEVVGGKENLFLYGQLNAFREGDENGDRPLMANTIGQFGSEKVRGPLSEMQSNMGISTGSFYLLWLLGALR
jgi:hypothetical protein